MARARKVHKQLSLLPTLDKNGQRRGGTRKGAGRPPRGPRSSEPHKRRTVFKGRHPLHVTIRAVKAVGSLRGFEVHRAVRKAMVTTYAKALIRIVHLSIQSTHIHLLVEANSRKTLARGMQGFEIACAKLINAAITKRTGCKRRGTVFPDRYHAEIITTPTQARNALSYVLNNWRRHGEHTRRDARGWTIDAYSTAPSFYDFKDIDVRAIQWIDEYEMLPTWRPRTWLLAEGWKKVGPIRSTETPGPRTTQGSTPAARR